MKWGSMASKCKGQGVPFGCDPQTDRFVWLSSVPLDRYGERCGLVCPSCGGKRLKEKVLAVNEQVPPVNPRFLAASSGVISGVGSLMP